MDVVVIAAGKLKDPALERLCQRYVQLCRPTLAIEVVELRSIDAVRNRMQGHVGPRIVLDERGDHPDSLEFAGWLQRWRDHGVRRLAFVLGDSHGLAHADREAADRVLSLSRMTLAHRIARLVLLEQLYRATTILAGHPYHH